MKIEFEDMSRGPIAELKGEGIHFSFLGEGVVDITIYVSSEELEDFAFTITEKLSR
jgi:hypothetical protein